MAYINGKEIFFGLKKTDVKKEELTVAPKTEAQTFEPAEGAYYSKVNVLPMNLSALNVSENGEYTAQDCDGFSSVVVNVAGSGSADVVNVTFIGEGGSVLYVKPCIIGDDCYDPYKTGKIEKPTKESTPQHIYNYDGWSLTAGGDTDDSALSAVSEDRTVYAAFVAETRYYTVRFFDGEAVLKTESVAYGETATPPDAVKEGHIFIGWGTEDFTITEDTDFYAEFMEGVSFASATWEQIAAISDSGQASSVFNIGDERTITLTWSDGTTEDCVIRIAAFNADTLYDAAADAPLESKAGITIDTKGVPTKYTKSGLDARNGVPMNYHNVDIRSFMNNTILPSLPTDLQAVIKPTIVPSTSSYMRSTPKWCGDKVSGLSIKNLGFTDKFTDVHNTHYPIYKYGNDDNNGAAPSRIKCTPDGTARDYWLCERKTGLPNSSNGEATNVRANGMRSNRTSSVQLHAPFRFAI